MDTHMDEYTKITKQRPSNAKECEEMELKLKEHAQLAFDMVSSLLARPSDTRTNLM